MPVWLIVDPHGFSLFDRLPWLGLGCLSGPLAFTSRFTDRGEGPRPFRSLCLSSCTLV